MADVLECGHAFPTSSMIKSIFCERTANNTIHLKFIRVVGTTDTPIDCATFEEFINLLRQAIDVTGGIVALRVIQTNNAGGAEEIIQAARCAQHEDWWKIFARSFYLSNAGEVALHIMDVT